MFEFVTIFSRYLPVLTFVLTLFFCASGQAQNLSQNPLQISKPSVLFLDLNNAHEEIEAIEKILGAKYTLAVVPSKKNIPANIRTRIRQIGESKDAVNKALQERSQKCSTQPYDQKCNDYWKKLELFEVERQQLLGFSEPAQSSQALINELKILSLQPEVLVISGHHENGFFSGELIDLNLSHLNAWIQEQPERMSQLRTVILLGCDTSRDRLLENRIAPLFPQAKLIVGAEGPAPLRHEFRNLKFIEALMAKEWKLSQSVNPLDAQQATRNLRRHLWPVAMLWNGQYFAGTENAVKEPLDVLVKQAQAKDPRYKLTTQP